MMRGARVAIALAACLGALSLGSTCNQGEEIPLTSSATCGACTTVADCATGGTEVHCIRGRCQIPCATASECAAGVGCTGGYCTCDRPDAGAD